MTARVLPILLVLAVQAGAVFVPPDEVQPLFARDALPMDADRMRELSDALTVLARRPMAGDPAQERATAQLLALASRLNPANRRSRDLSRQLAAGGEVAPAHPRELAAARSRSWELAEWLHAEDTGPEGQLVGQQLIDALRIVDPGHPGGASHQAAGEDQRWKGVVAPLSRFQPRAEPPDPSPPPKPDPPEPALPPVPRPPAPPIRLAEAQLLTPLEVLLGQSRQTALVPLSLRVTQAPEHEELELSFQPVPRSDDAQEALRNCRARALEVLAGKWGRLPEHQLATLENGGNAAYSSRNATALSGPAALLLSSAISGKPLRKDLIFLGDVASDGSIAPPPLAWHYLHTLRGGQGGRLLVPLGFEAQLRALLALEEPDFFIRYEVVAVRTLDQALRMAVDHPDTDPLAETDQDFARFREITAPASIGPLAVNKHVRERLGKILAANPGHLSAKMILLQGSSRRPTRLDRSTLALELQRCLDPMAWILRDGLDPRQLQAADLESAYEACRRQLDPLESVVDRPERPLHAESREIVGLLRTIARILQRNDPALVVSFTELRERHTKLVQALQAPPADNAPPRKNPDVSSVSFPENDLPGPLR